jgi:hypothetical protein
MTRDTDPTRLIPPGLPAELRRTAEDNLVWWLAQGYRLTTRRLCLATLLHYRGCHHRDSHEYAGHWHDHVSIWTRAGHVAAIVAQPYGWFEGADDELRRDVAIAGAGYRGALRYRVEPARSWHYPNWTVLVVIERAPLDEVPYLYLEEQWLIRAAAMIDGLAASGRP